MNSDNIVYYKICYPESIIMFYHDVSKNRLDGLVEEYKTNNKIIVFKHESEKYYDDLENNAMAKAMLGKAKKISKEEYDTADFVAKSLINGDWLIADNDYKEKEIVTETVYV